MTDAISPKEKNNKTGCRYCGTPLKHTVVDLGMSPLCQTHITPDMLNQPEPFYPLHVYVCERCLLVQLEEFVPPADIFTEYAYFSSYSDSWVEHARNYVEQMVERFSLDSNSQVIEIASNDGYLLQHFVKKNIPVLGIEPAANVAKAATDKGINTLVCFHGRQTAREVVRRTGRADLLLGNNVLAHVPDLNGFVAGLKVLLKPDGVITMEFPHLYRLMSENQFDTIYHEHFSYFSFIAVQRMFAGHGLHIFDLEQLPTHGGSLRIYAQHVEYTGRTTSSSVAGMRQFEEKEGFGALSGYSDFGKRVAATKRALLSLLIDIKNAGGTIAGYGAPGKGNTLLNYCGIGTDFIDYTVDRNPYKQGKYTPGTRIPILNPERLRETRPDYILILPWNLKDEIIRQNNDMRAWGCKFIVPIPEAKVLH